MDRESEEGRDRGREVPTGLSGRQEVCGNADLKSGSYKLCYVKYQGLHEAFEEYK